ncbi:MAG: hypothetical protein GWO00_04930, partial [Gemmatimonadetes bacterium]|nr:hypothetical protein [Gemmatimonadota bacterium]
MEANLATDLAGPAARKWFSAADEAVTVDRWINRIFGWEKGAKDVPGRP